VIPFGPQHPVLPEPLHLDLVVEDETVVEAVPSIGFIHRGLEKLVEKIEFTEFTHIAERICGICSFIHGLTYCQGIERLMQVEVPPRVLYLRTFWSELSRVHSHLLWLGLMADAMGFESLFMHVWRLRVRTPTFANLAPLLAMLKGCQVADVPVVVLTIDPCISCAQR
jgi:ech hydrogenase subunit E